MNTKNMNEKLIERKLREEVKKLGGLALKFSSPSFTGMPDRLIILPGGVTLFVEVKSTGKKPEPLQQAVIAKLRKIGHRVEVLDSQESLDKLLNSLR